MDYLIYFNIKRELKWPRPLLIAVSWFHFELGAVVLVDEGIKCQCVSIIEANVAVNITR